MDPGAIAQSFPDSVAGLSPALSMEDGNSEATGPFSMTSYA
jgi:hypothetical protein